MAGATAFSLQELVACAERELKLRERIYPQRVRDGRMSRQFADDQIAKMQQIAARLRELEQAEQLV
jgi:hypothetical protein